MKQQSSSLNKLIQFSAKNTDLAEKALSEFKNTSSIKKQDSEKTRWVNIKLFQQLDTVLTKAAYKERFTKGVLIRNAIGFILKKYEGNYLSIERIDYSQHKTSNILPSKSMMLELDIEAFEKFNKASIESRLSKRELICIAIKEYLYSLGYTLD